MRQSSTEEFIEKARARHGDRFDYSLVDYKKSVVKVIVICPIHGQWKITPTNHLNGKKCPGCRTDASVRATKKTVSDFLIRARAAHGDRYDYSLIKYIKTSVKVEIVCREHGRFWQTPTDHMAGGGCAQCAINSRVLTTEIFIDEAIKRHGQTYDYSEVEYKHSHQPVKIKCSKHGIFEQKPVEHLRSSGCPLCQSNHKLTQDDFVRRSVECHGQFYDYSLVVYKNVRTKVKIICPKHGAFLQGPRQHFMGDDCPKCVLHNYSLLEDLWLHIMGIPDDKDSRHISLRLPSGRRINADGYDGTNCTVYEFYGSFYHGDPILYKKRAVNQMMKKTYGELYNKTMQREKEVRDAGFDIVSIWESGFWRWLIDYPEEILESAPNTNGEWRHLIRSAKSSWIRNFGELV